MQSRNARINIVCFNKTTNVKHYGNYALMRKDIAASRAVQEVMRIIDAKKAGKKHGKKKLEHRCNFVDIDARNIFKLNAVTLSIIKCAHSFNHFRF